MIRQISKYRIRPRNQKLAFAVLLILGMVAVALPLAAVTAFLSGGLMAGCPAGAGTRGGRALRKPAVSLGFQRLASRMGFDPVLPTRKDHSECRHATRRQQSAGYLETASRTIPWRSDAYMGEIWEK